VGLRQCRQPELFLYYLQNFPIIFTFLGLRVLENRVVRGIIEPKRDEVTGE
jgi:hypothetical protein